VELVLVELLPDLVPGAVPVVGVFVIGVFVDGAELVFGFVD
jgi:hypothetical protein